MSRFGRLPEFDERSRNFPIRTLLPVLPPRSYTWSCPAYLDQGREGACVGFAFSHEAAARPVKVPSVTDRIASDVYRRARELDQWPGENYSGTSVIAGAKACVERGWYQEYRWAFSLDEIIRTIGYRGPVVLGVNWYEGMESTDGHGHIHVAGEVLGGHSLLANGVSIKNRIVRLHNSWGDDWGMRSECFISFDDLERLLHEQGEACIPIGRKLPVLRRITGAIMNRISMAKN